MSHAPRALLSVSDKTGLVDFARALAEAGFEVISTGGSAKAIAAAGVAVTDVASITGFPEIMAGRVKTLHPTVHGGILGRRGTDEATMAEHAIRPIDIVAVNLYPFEQTIARGDASFADAIENIDIGGPAMIRAAAKNHAAVTVVVDPNDYERVAATLTSGGPGAELRAELAARAFRHTAFYDTVISQYLLDHNGAMPDGTALTIAAREVMTLRYGENPHQSARLYRDPGVQTGTLAASELLQGKPLSYNNLADADAALECVRQFETPACVIVKHANPCGVATAPSVLAAYEAAYRTDPTSAFGGIIAFNSELDAATAETIIDRQFVEVLLAPSVDAAARQVLAKRTNLRLLQTGDLTQRRDAAFEIKKISGGLLVQDRDDGVIDAPDLRVVTERKPSADELRDLLFAWKVVKYVKSNAIVFCRENATLGIGAGQMSRVYSTRIAAIKAADESLTLTGSVLASDAFFPFRDGLDAAAEHGIRAVIQPGGSKRDNEVITAANEHGLAMVMTGMRHFRH
ncbi:MAG: bifunctional phosphoribosylaminoimidazolecarboxamide formyltransferase/IMP cyclohydrolase [Pseudomonadota bacterium]